MQTAVGQHPNVYKKAAKASPFSSHLTGKQRVDFPSSPVGLAEIFDCKEHDLLTNNKTGLVLPVNALLVQPDRTTAFKKLSISAV